MKIITNSTCFLFLLLLVMISCKTVTGPFPKYDIEQNEQGLIVEKTWYDSLGNVAEDKWGISIYQNDYNEKGLLIEQRFYDQNEELTSCENCERKYNWDWADDNDEPSIYFDNGKNPKFNPDSGSFIAIYKYLYNDEGKLDTIKCYDTKRRQNLTLQIYFNIKRNKRSRSDSLYTVREHINFFDGNLWEFPEGYFFKYKGQIKRFFHVKRHHGIIADNRRNQPSAIYETVSYYDVKKLTEETSHFDVRGNLCMSYSSDWFAMRRVVKDMNRKILEISYYDETGNLYNKGRSSMGSNRGAAKIINRYDEKKRVIESRNYGRDNRLINNSMGVSVYKYEYDSICNQRTLFAMYDKNMNIAQTKPNIGNPINHYKYDADCNVIEAYQIAISGYYYKSKEGGVFSRMEYDEKRNMIKSMQLDSAKQLICYSKHKYDTLGCLLETRFYNAKGKHTEDAKGVALTVYKRYSGCGVEEVCWYDSEGRPKRNNGRSHCWRSPP